MRLAALVLLAAGCRFDASGHPPLSSDGAPAAGDATVDRAWLPPDGLRAEARGDLPVTPIPDGAGADGVLPPACSALHKCKPDGKKLETCDQNGDFGKPEIDCPLGCQPAASRCFGFTISSKLAALVPALPPSNSPLVIGGRTVLDTDSGTADPPLSGSGSFFCPAGVSVCALLAGSLKVTKDGVIRGQGSRPLAILASGELVIEGLVDVSAAGTSAGPGGNAGGDITKQGAGCSGGPGGGFYSQGGAGGSFGYYGGKGGSGPTSLAPCGDICPAGAGGVGALAGGSGGGGGSPWLFGSGGGHGGAGGGAVQLTALASVIVSGAVVAGGGGGRGGDSGGSGGGGGSGGAIIIEAPKLTISGQIAANGGGGGGGGCAIGDGSKGDDGANSLKSAKAGGGCHSALGMDGGDGGTGSSATVAKGGDGKGGSGTGHNGGGGGGAGRICLRSGDGKYGSAKLSPELDAGNDWVRVWQLDKQ